MKLLIELFSKKTALQVKLSCAKQALIEKVWPQTYEKNTSSNTVLEKFH
jgi:hypothetical protein